ncbi:MAG TPA: hypothetical protein VFC07_11000, partial [Verrucomicrobiae bacterium]|nr:hypothetical protein [Verrucomicrobiae bacterium]
MKSLRRYSVFFCTLLLVTARVQAQLPLLIGQNFTGSTYGDTTAAIPPDCNGTVGPTDFVEFINDQFAIYDKATGVNTVRISALDFWSSAIPGFPSSLDVSDPRIIYDPSCQRWFASMVDLDPNAIDPTVENNDFLLAVSVTSDPAGDWKGFRFRASPSGVKFADFPTLGVDKNAVYLSGDFFHGSTSPIGPGLVSIPKADLLLATPTIARRTFFAGLTYAVRGQVLQPVMCFDGTSSGNVVATGNIGMTSNPYSNLVCFAVQNASTASASLTAPINLSVPPYMVPDNPDLGPVFTPTQPDGTSQLQANDARFSARVYGEAGVLYAVHNTELNNHIAIRWYRINASTLALLESGTIA